MGTSCDQPTQQLCWVGGMILRCGVEEGYNKSYDSGSPWLLPCHSTFPSMKTKRVPRAQPHQDPEAVQRFWSWCPGQVLPGAFGWWRSLAAHGLRLHPRGGASPLVTVGFTLETSDLTLKASSSPYSSRCLMTRHLMTCPEDLLLAPAPTNPNPMSCIWLGGCAKGFAKLYLYL